MSFDAKSLLTAPLPPDLTVDAMRARLDELARMGFGKAPLKMQDGQSPNMIDLVAQGTEPAHFVMKRTTK